MSSSEAYLGAFNGEAISVTINKQLVEICLSYMNDEEKNEITQAQWKLIYEAIYKSDAVSDFIDTVVQIAQETLDDLGEATA